MMGSAFPEHRQGGHSFIDEGPADGRGTLLLLHGMIGGPGNWDETVRSISAEGYRVIVPLLPVVGLPKASAGVPGLVEYVVRFMDDIGLSRSVVVGNSLGGHVATMLTLKHPDRVQALVLLGASGIHEVDMGDNLVRRKDRDFIRERAAVTFFDPAHASEALVDEVYAMINDRSTAMQLIRMARSAKREVVTDQLSGIELPTLVVWGKQDRITTPDVAETFSRLVKGAELHWIDRCGHAPMMERPDEFNGVLLEFLERRIAVSAVA